MNVINFLAAMFKVFSERIVAMLHLHDNDFPNDKSTA